MPVRTFPSPDVIIRATARVGEGPVWDPRTSRFCWVDIDRGLLFENDLATGDQTVTDSGTILGAALPRLAHPGFAVAVEDGLGFLVDGALEIVDRVLPEPFTRMNDAKCDSHGRLWAGSTHKEFVPGVGTLHRWTGLEPSTAVATGFTLPNGIGWNAEDTVMYLVDSMTRELLHANYYPDDGEIGEFSALAAVDSGLPDGLAVDVDGCVWVAVWDGWEVRRYDPTGELIGRIPMPVARPSSCAFADDGTLFITSASADDKESGDKSQPLAGSVFALASTTLGVIVEGFGA